MLVVQVVAWGVVVSVTELMLLKLVLVIHA